LDMVERKYVASRGDETEVLEKIKCAQKLVDLAP
jgi:hypothetical protein